MPAPPFSGGGDDPKRAVVESQMGVRSSSSRSRWVRVAAPLNPGAGNARTRRLPSVLRMPQSRHNTTESSDVAIDERAVHRSGHLPGQRWGEQVMPPEDRTASGLDDGPRFGRGAGPRCGNSPMEAGRQHLERETMAYNYRRLRGACCDVPPAEYEAPLLSQPRHLGHARVPMNRASIKPSTVQPNDRQSDRCHCPCRAATTPSPSPSARA
jgi:hypothetical protein